MFRFMLCAHSVLFNSCFELPHGSSLIGTSCVVWVVECLSVLLTTHDKRISSVEVKCNESTKQLAFLARACEYAPVSVVLF
jgi:hypothetical protein